MYSQNTAATDIENNFCKEKNDIILHSISGLFEI